MSNSTRRALLTGATGLIGPEIVQGLLANGFMVYAISRNPPESAVTGLHWIRGDLSRNGVQLLASVPPVDTVVHAGAHITDDGTMASMASLRTTNMAFSEALSLWAQERAVSTVVYISSLSVLSRPLRETITEEHPVGPGTPYAISKYWGELVFSRSKSSYRSIVLRITSPVPGQLSRMHSTVVRHWISAARQGDILRIHGRGDRTQDFVACEDIAGAVLAAVTSADARGLYHIGSGTQLSMRHLAEMISASYGVATQFVGEDERGDERWNVSVDKAACELGYRPRFTGEAVIRRLLEERSCASPS